MVFPCRGAQASVFTWRWAAGDIGGVTVLASPAVFTVAPRDKIRLSRVMWRLIFW